MKTCCVWSFANKGMREHFRIANENESHTCPTCGTVFRLVAGKWREATGGTHTTVNTFEVGADEIDFGWARATRDRARGVLIVQCWGCGGITEVPDEPLIEFHFDHATGNCSHALALRNHQRGTMPTVRAH